MFLAYEGCNGRYESVVNSNTFTMFGPRQSIEGCLTYILTTKITIGELQAISSWSLLVLIIGLLVGCGTATEPSAPTPTSVASPTPSATPTPLPTATPALSATPTQSPTPQVGARVEFVILDCITAFCIPSELEREVRRVEGKPGVLSVQMVGEYHVGLDYDPNQITQAEAVEVFESSTGYDVEVTQ